MRGEGFEPSQALRPQDLKSCPFGQSQAPPPEKLRLLSIKVLQIPSSPSNFDPRDHILEGTRAKVWNAIESENLHVADRKASSGLESSGANTSLEYCCKRCGRFFVERDGFEGKHHPKEVIVQALHLCVEGLSLSKIREGQNFEGEPT